MTQLSHLPEEMEQNRLLNEEVMVRILLAENCLQGFNNFFANCKFSMNS